MKYQKDTDNFSASFSTPYIYHFEQFYASNIWLYIPTSHVIQSQMGKRTMDYLKSKNETMLMVMIMMEESPNRIAKGLLPWRKQYSVFANRLMALAKMSATIPAWYVRTDPAISPTLKVTASIPVNEASAVVM